MRPMAMWAWVRVQIIVLTCVCAADPQIIKRCACFSKLYTQTRRLDSRSSLAVVAYYFICSGAWTNIEYSSFIQLLFTPHRLQVVVLAML